MNIYIINQKSLFLEDNHKISYLIKKENQKDWTSEEILSKEFESVGFYISNHPLKNYEDILKQYNVKLFNDFENDNNSQSFIAGTLMQLKEKKTAKGNPFAIAKFSDLSKSYELFLFSEVLELNREHLIEGKSLLLTVLKDKKNQENRFRRINVRKIVSLDKIWKHPQIDFIYGSLDGVTNGKVWEEPFVDEKELDESLKK